MTLQHHARDYKAELMVKKKIWSDSSHSQPKAMHHVTSRSECTHTMLYSL